MSIDVRPIQRVFRYNGFTLPDVPGLAPREVRDLYSAQYPELVSAEVEAGEVHHGEQEFVFRKTVGVKGATPRRGERLAALRQQALDAAQGRTGSDARIVAALSRRRAQVCHQAWSQFAETGGRRGETRACPVVVPSDVLAPLP